MTFTSNRRSSGNIRMRQPALETIPGSPLDTVPPPYVSTEQLPSGRDRSGRRATILAEAIPPQDSYTAMPMGRRSTRAVEEGRLRDPYEVQVSQSATGGVLSSIIDLYTSRQSETRDRRHGASTPYPMSVASSRASSIDSILRGTMLRRRTASAISVGTDADALDFDDPHVTGAVKNDIDEKNEKALALQKWKDGTHPDDPDDEKSTTERNLKLLLAKQAFILKLSKALMLYGAPSHRLESQLVATARVLSVPCQVIHFPGVVLITFHDIAAKTSETHVVKSSTRLMLGKLHRVHMIYRGVVHSQIGVQDGTDQLKRLIKSKPIYTTGFRCLFAVCCAFIISLTAFGGSVLDACIAGCFGGTLAYLQLHAVKRSVMYANIFEISTAIWVSFVARGLSSWQGDYFCYSAMSSAGVVLILPGFAVLTSALELASKNYVSGSARLVWAIAYTLFLSFSLTAGSDLWFLIDSSARDKRQEAVSSLVNEVWLGGSFDPNPNGTEAYNTLTEAFGTQLSGVWTFVNQTSTVSKQFHYQQVGCYRDPTWPWYRRALPVWTLFPLVPLYCMFSSFWNLQPWKSKQLPVMIAISCFSYAARKTLQHFIGARNEVVSAVGAFVIGLLGNVYARVFKGTAFTCMVTAVCFLVPSSIAAAGGLAMNYTDSGNDQYTSTIEIGVRMLTVAIGTSVGLLLSSLTVYTFGPKKKSALFAF